MQVQSTRELPTFNQGEKVQLTYSTHDRSIKAILLNHLGGRVEIQPENLPREFKKIESSLHFEALLRNAFARTQIMSDGEFRLYIAKKGFGGAGTGEKVVDAAPGPLLVDKIMPTVLEGTAEIQGKDIKDNAIILAGRTGVGKSVLGNLMSGQKIKGVVVNHKNKFDFEDPIFPVGHSMESCTSCPNVHSQKEKDFTYIDFPGFDDTKTSDDIINTIFREKTMENVKNFKIVFVVDYNDFSGRGSYLPETIDNLLKFLGVNDLQDEEKLERLVNSITLVVTKVKVKTAEDNEEIRDMVRKDLMAYANGENENLSETGQAILNRLIGSEEDDYSDERWEIFSEPTFPLETSSRPWIEQRKITDLVHKKSEFFNKSDIQIRAEVSNKYRDEIKTDIDSLIRGLKRDFAGRVSELVISHLKYSFNNFSTEHALRVYQEHFQSLINNTTVQSLSELIQDLKLDGRILEEAQEYDKKLKFLVGLLSDRDKSLNPTRREWIGELGMRDTLRVWNNYMLNTLQESKISVVGSKLYLHGYFPKLSQLTKNLSSYGNIKDIEIYGFHTMTKDENLVGEKFRGVNVVSVAPKQNNERDREIDLTGNDCTRVHEHLREVIIVDGAQGTNGAPGYEGDNGGNYVEIGSSFSGLENLTVKSNGGKGGTGQNGGSGHPGANGTDGTVKRDYVQTKEGAFSHGTVIAISGWQHKQFPPFDHGNGTHDVELRNDGDDGQLGGNAGKGGAGGNGGLAGQVTLYSLKGSETIKSITNNGEFGTNGTMGNPGEGGLKGKEWSGKWHLGGNPDNDWNGHPDCQPQHRASTHRSPSGTIPTEFNTENREPPADQQSIDINQVMFNHRKFMIQWMNPLTEETLVKFLQLCDSDPNITSKATLESFISECEQMEDLYTEIDVKTKCIPLYQSMLNRLQAFEVANNNPRDVALIQSLYTLTLSKLCQLNASLDSRLIIDIKSYLNRIDRNIEDLNRQEHDVRVAVYEEEYLDQIQSQIQESDIFIEKLSQDVRAASAEIDKQIDILLKEIEAMEANSQAKKEEIAAKRDALDALLNKKQILGTITIAVQCVGYCFPPYGPIVAGVVSAGLTIWSNAEQAPVIGAQLLSTYAEGISEVLKNDSKIQMGQVHVAALARVREYALAQAAMNVIPSGDAQAQLKAMSKVIKEIDEQQKQLVVFKDKVRGSFKDSLHEMVGGAEKIQKALQNTSKIALDYSKLSIKRVFANIKGQIKACTRIFSAGEGFLNIIRQLEEALDTTASIYDHIQDYEERKKLVSYMARLSSSNAGDPRIDVYKLKVQRNLILEQYNRAFSAVRQWAFPYASHFLGDFTILEQFAKNKTIDSFMAHVKLQLGLLKNKIDTYQSEINSGIDTVLWRGNFSPTTRNGSFYAWDGINFKNEISDLMKGKPVVLYADASRTTNATSAVKFTHIELHVKCSDPLIQKEIQKELKGVIVEMNHSGLSHYKFKDKIYQMSNDRGFSLKYQYAEKGDVSAFNEVYRKMMEGIFMLSPYTQWIIKLDVEESFYKKFEKRLPKIEIHLTGRGQYVYTDKVNVKKWKVDEYDRQIVNGTAHPFVQAISQGAGLPPQGPSKKIAGTEDAHGQKDDQDYLYQASDIHGIVKSPTVTQELEGFQFIQGLQADYLSKKLDEVMNHARSGKPVVCVYNLSNIHWVTFCIYRKANGQIIALYKDSFGSRNHELMELLRGRTDEFKSHPGTEQRGNGTLCGIMALENMRMIVRELKAHPEEFITHYESFAFCSLQHAKDLRGGDYPRFFTEGAAASQLEETQNNLRLETFARDHQSKVDHIIGGLREVSASMGITLHSQKIPTGTNRAVSIAIGSDQGDFTNYLYLVSKSKDLTIKELRELLMCSPFALHENTDYEINKKDGVIRIPHRSIRG